MSVPSIPPQGGSGFEAAKPEAAGSETGPHTGDSTTAATTDGAEAVATLPPDSDYDASQEDMAHEYVDYYVTNPVDRKDSAQAGTAVSPNTVSPDAISSDDPADPAADLPAAPPASDYHNNSPAISPNGPAGDLPPSPPAGEGKAQAAPYEDASLVKQQAPPASSPAAPPPSEAKAMSLMDHLGELRSRLMRSAIAVALAFAATYSVADLIFAQLMRPLLAALPPNSKLIFTALPEAFFVYLQVGFVAAIFVASPYIFYQVWGFIAPGLYEEEKKFAVPMALCSAFFFMLGAAFCFLVVFPFSFTFFVGFATEDIVPMPSLSEYLGFALKMLIAFGLIFEMPLFTFFLARMGLITAALMRKTRRYAVLVIFIVAAILTPPDVMSQMLMAVPMLLLYEFSIYIALAFGKKPKPESTDAQDNTESPKDNSENTGAQAPQG